MKRIEISIRRDAEDDPDRMTVLVLERHGVWCVTPYVHLDRSIVDGIYSVSHAYAGLNVCPRRYTLQQAKRLARQLGKQHPRWGEGCDFQTPASDIADAARVAQVVHDFNAALQTNERLSP